VISFSGNFLSMHCLANHAQGRFEVSVGSFESIGINRQRGSEDNEGRSIPGTGNRLLEAQSAYCLNRHAYGIDHLAELIERTRHAVSRCCNSSSLIIADMMDDVAASQIFKPFCS
jgi:hypothetical protein